MHESNPRSRSPVIPAGSGVSHPLKNRKKISVPGTLQEFQSIHQSFRPKILRYLTQLVGENEAEDLTQIVMIKVSKALPKFRGDSALSTWIYRIATNTARDKLRTPATKWAAQQLDSAENQSARGPDSERQNLVPEKQAPSAQATMIRKEMSDCIREFMDLLPESYKTVLVLSELEQLKNSEIAEILGISLETVKIRLHRAREKFRKELGTACTFFRDERNEFACDRKR
jgi:RNA polymerase sigma-70 factor (ECF subfamily)